MVGVVGYGLEGSGDGRVVGLLGGDELGDGVEVLFDFVFDEVERYQVLVVEVV